MRSPPTRFLWTQPAKTPARRQGSRPRHRLLRLEQLETRRLLTSTDLAAIAGRAFRDANGDGYTPGEDIAGAMVTLQRDLNANGVLDAGDGPVLALAVTDAVGSYSFQRLAAGDYFVQLPGQVAGSITVRQQTSPLIVITSADAAGIPGAMIDGFSTVQSVIAVSPVGAWASSSAAAAEALGGERDLLAQLSAGGPTDYLQMLSVAGQLTLDATYAATGISSVVWDGPDGNGTVLDPTGLRVAGQGVDLTAGGFLSCLRLTLGVDKPNGTAAVRIYTDGNNWSQAVATLSDTAGQPNAEYVVSFSDFTVGGGTGADFSDVGAIVLEITSDTPAMDGQLTLIESRGATVLTQDFDNAQSADLSLTLTVDNAAPLVGSNVTYTVTVNNAGPDGATNVVVSEWLPAELTFVSATASAGSYNNTSGFWTVGSLALGSSATLQLIAAVTGADTIVNTVEVAAVAQPDPDSTPNNGAPTEDDQSSITLTPETPAAPDLVAFAQALTAAGVKFYGAAWSEHCSGQKALFEDGADYLPFIEVTNPDRTLNQVGIDENITSFPTWEFPDDSRLVGMQTLDTISQRSGVAIPLSSNPFVKPIEDLTLLGGSPLMVPLDGYDPNGGLLTYTVTSDNPALVTPALQQGNPSLQIATDAWGSMAFQMFQDKAPRPVERVTQLAQDGFYEGIIFHRVIEGFVIQGGDPTGTGTGGSTLGDFDDQFHVDLQHNRAGLISYAKSVDDTNDSQFFVTLAPTRYLDFNHSIFGVLVEGYPVLEAIGSTATNASDKPVYDIVMESVDIFADQENGVVMLKAAEGASGQANITVTVADPQGHTLQRTFQVTVLPDTTANGGANGGPFLQDIAPVTTPLDTPVDIQLAAIDVEGDPVYYDATPISGAPYTVSVNHDTGLVTVTPNSGFSGQTTVRVAVRAVSGSDTYDTWDTQSVPLTVLPSGPEHQVRLRLEAADLAGNAITTITSGGEFLLKLYAQDVRPDAEGVFAVYLDVNYDPALVSTVDTSLTFSEPYVNGKSGDLTTPGLIDEGGAFDGWSVTGDAEMLVFSVRMRADQSGEAQFVGDPADGVGHEILVYEDTSPVPWEAVQFVPAEISILPVAPDAPDLVAFAQALTAAGVKFYGAAWSEHCSGQKALFEDGADYLPFIEVTNPDRTLNQVGIDENIIAFPTWEFPDDSRLTGIQTLDTISQRSGVAIPLSSNPFVKPIEDLTLLGGSPLMVPLDGYDPNGGLLTYTITSDNPALVTPTLQQGNPSLQIATDSWGSMAFQLFQDKAWRPVERVTQLAQDGFYEGIIFHRVIEGFVIQGGDPTGTGTGGSTLGDFDDQYHVDLQHNRAGLISYAKSVDDTNDSQFFVTLAPTRYLDFNHSIFGVLVEGYPVLEAIGSTVTNASDKPIYDIVMESVDIFADQENGVVMLKAAEGASGQANITVTVADPQGHTLQRTFQVTVLPDTAANGGANGGPFLQDIAPVTTPLDTPVDIQLAAIDVEGDPVYYDATPVSGAPYTVSVDHGTGLVTVTPNAGFSGQTTVTVKVRAVSGSDTYDTWDTQSVPLTVLPSGPTQQVRLRLEAADLAGNAITTIASGGEFLLKLYAQDLRPDAEGVFAAYLDVAYDPALVSAVDTSLTFSEPYVNGKSGDLSTPGLIDEGGAFDGFSHAGDAEMLVFSVRMRADQSGEAQFVGEPADGVGHEILVYGETSLVPWEAVQFVPAEITILPELDFGDAPLPYATTLAEDGARHSATGPRLGLQRDKEGDGVHSAGADGDDLAGTPDDEDGVTLVRPLVVGQQDAAFTINVQQAPAGAKLDAWLDFNADGSWDGPDEWIVEGLSVADGDNQFTFAIPAWAAEGATYARFRLSTAGELLPTGWTADGEVEDYQVTITRHLLVVLPGGNGSDDITVRRRGADVEVYDNVGKTVLASGPLACVLSVSIQGADVENDRVTVDYAYGGFFELRDGVSFDGGAGGHDELAVQGSGTTVARYVSRGGELGDATIVTAEGVQHNEVRFTRVEPLTLRGLLVCNVEGALHVGGQTLTLEVATMTALDWLTTLAGGSVVAGGGVTLGSGDNLLGSGVVQARVAAAVGSSLRATGALELGDSASLAGFYSDGELYTSAGPLTIHDANEAVLGTLTVLGDADRDGTLAGPHGLLLEAGKAFQGRGVVSTADGQFQNNGYVVGLAPNLTFQQLVTGIGDFAGPIVFNGGYSPGLSPAQIDFFDGVTFSTTNTLTIELGGRTPGDEFDRLDVAGQAQLGGTLDVDLIDGFVPVVGDSFEIISAAGGVAGTFATETLPALPAGRRWQVQYHADEVTLAVVPATLIVTQLTPTPSGFVAHFSGELKLAGLNLYDRAGGALGPADVILKDGANHVVAGSMVVADDRQAIEFVKTGGPLLPGSYTVTLRSGASAFRDVDDGPLDGNQDGTSGDDFTAPLTVAESSDRVVSLPDMARGAGQSVNIPNLAAGLPIRLDNAAGVTSLAVDLVYEQTLLQITAATLAAGVPADWSVALDASTAGVAKITASGATPLTGANVDVVRLTAAVPNPVPYGAVQAIRLEHVACNAGALAAVGDVAVHKAVYLGDADGSGVHSSADAFLTVQAALGSASGFAAHSWTDPRIVGDGDGSGALSAADAFLVVQEALGLSEPFLPDNPHITVTPVGSGVDPQFRIDGNIPASAGGAVIVPLQLAIEPAATNVGACDFDLFFDPSQLTIQLPGGVWAGADTAGWAMSAVLVAPGQLRVGMVSSSGRPLAVGLREIARLQFRVEASAGSAASRRWSDDPLQPALPTPGCAVALNIEPLDPRAGGYTWTDADGSVLIGPAVRGLAGATRERVWRDVDATADLLENVLADLVHGLAPAGR